MFNVELFGTALFAPMAAQSIPEAMGSGKGYAPLVIAASYLEVAAATGTGVGIAILAIGDTIISEPPAATGTGEGRAPRVACIVAHAILRPQYFEEGRLINRVYVVGTDRDGNMVYGEAIDNSINGEKLQIQTIPALTSYSEAQSVASNILSKTRLFAERGRITIPPNCGIELYDVIEINDTVCNQTTENYRVSGWLTVYRPTSGEYYQIVGLTSV